MAKGLNKIAVSLEFTADTKQAKQELQQLQQTILNLTSPQKNQLGLKINGIEEFSKASAKVAEFSTILETAKNKSGTLDLGKLSQSLKKNNTTLSAYAKTLNQLGPEGEQAFVQLARSINHAGASMKKSYGILTEFKTTLANTARWQISSSILHGFMGAVQSAYGYAQDLNESLNDIRIVTGYNTDQMAKFAKEANKAAKALSTTTTEYTNASLIYFQQGLNDQQVKERTDITVKMANVSKQNAETVSDQMTAVWNNFYDGSKSLEYYADVMTKLGAATASSSDEIAQGLEKFAAIADTVGLSYDYAASALATVTAETRQSADVVGTAFKTIFARIEGLSLGETLEDGTDLNKYSAALATVGVNIKDTNGEMKQMDQILEEMGSRWQTLGQDQKIALAQTVAGVRQYNQLIALMDNWGTFQENLFTAQTSEGALQEQANIYAESWEAARDRVTAAAETIYQQLLDDEFFIAITDGFGKFLEILSNTIDTLGGLPGVLSIISSLLFKIYGSTMTNAIQTFTFNIQAQKKSFSEMMTLRKDANKGVKLLLGDETTEENQAQNVGLLKEFELYDKIIVKKEQLKSLGIEITESEEKLLNILTQQQAEYTEAAKASGKRLDTAQQNSNEVQNNTLSFIQQRSDQNQDIQHKYGKDKSQQEIAGLKSSTKSLGVMSSVRESILKMSDVKDIEKQITIINKYLKSNSTEGEKFKKVLSKIDSGELKTTADVLIAIDEELQEAGSEVQEFDNAIRAGLRRIGVEGEEADSILQRLRSNFYSEGEETFGMVENLALIEEKANDADKVIDDLQGPPPTALDGFMTLAQGISNVAMVASSLKGMFDTWNNEDLSFGDKLISTFTTLGMIIPVVTTAFNKNSLAQLGMFTASMTSALGLKTESLATLQDAAAKGDLTAANVTATASTWTLLWPIGLLIAAIAAIVAGIALLVKAYQEAQPEFQLKEAQEEANRLATELERARDASESLKESIEGYDSAIEKIRTLEKGTREWREAIDEANMGARQLIEKYGEELSGKWSFNAETGLIEFEKDALSDLETALNDKFSFAQSQYLMGQNAVNNAQLGVTNKNAATRNDKEFFEHEVAISPGVVVSPYTEAQGILGQLIAQEITQAIENSKQTKAIEKLQESYEETQGNYLEALNRLDESDRALINSLGLTNTELQELCEASEANTAAILANNKQIIDINFANNETYQKSNNKDFLSDVLAGDLEDKTTELYESKYQDGKLSDKKAQQQYAEAMGWDPNLVKNKTGNKAVYINDEGEEVTISDEQIRKYLAQQEALKNLNGEMEETSQRVNQLVALDSQLASQVDGTIDSFETYKTELHAQGEALGFTTQEIDKYIESQGELQKLAKASIISENFQTMSYKGEDLDANSSKQLAQSLAQGLDEEQLAIAVQVSAEATSLDEFGRSLQDALHRHAVEGIQNSSEEIKSILSEATETETFTTGQTDAILAQEEFQEFLENSGKTEVEFIRANYSEKMAIITQYYTELKALETEQLQASRANYQKDLEEYQAIIDYKNAVANNDIEAISTLVNQYSNIDFEAYLDMDISEVETKLDEVNAAIEELDNQQIKLDMEWDTTDVIEDGIKKIGSFAKMMEKDTKRVGSSYQMTAAQAREWMQVYPDLFKNAEVTTEGLISLNGDYVDEFISGQEASTDSAIDSNIKQLESRLSELEGEKKATEADLELAKIMAEGKMELAGASKEYLAETREKLTQYYIDCGLDEQAANKAALETMQLNEKTYSDAVAAATSRNAENQIESAEAGAEGTVEVLLTLSQRFKAFFDGISQAWSKVMAGDFTGAWDSFKSGWSAGISGSVNVTNRYQDSAYDFSGDFKTGSGYKRTATIQEIGKAQVEDLTKQIATIDSSIESIRSEIVYNQALKNQDLSDYGSTDPDSGGSDKSIEDLIKAAERYHEIKKQIEGINHELDILSKKKDRAFGKAKVELMDQEIQKLGELAEKERELLDAQTVFLAIDKQNLEDTFSNVQFDEKGNIANYSQIQQQIINEYNAAKIKFNNSAQTEEDKAALEAAEKVYEEKLDLLEQYEETVKEHQDQQIAYLDALFAEADAKLDKLEYTIEINLDIKDQELKLLETLLSGLEDQAYSQAEAIGYLAQSYDIEKGKADDHTAGINQIMKENLSKDDFSKWVAGEEIDWTGYKEQFTPEEIEALKGHYDGLQEAAQNLANIDKQIREKYVEAFEEWNETLDRSAAKIEHIGSVIDNLKNIADLTKAFNGFDSGLTKLFANAGATVAQAQANAAKSTYDATVKALEDAKASGILSEEELRVFEDRVQEAESNLLSSANTAIQAFLDEMTTAVESTLRDYEKQMSGTFGSFEAMSEGLERYQETSSRYVADYEKIYKLSKLNRDLQQDMDKSLSNKSRQQYAELMEEIAQYAQEGVEMSAYDVEFLEKKIELRKAEIALQEAQNAKTAVIRRRDDMGNWGYVYTADQEKAADALQNYEDKLYEITKFNEETMNQISSDIVGIYQQFSDAMNNIHQRWLEGYYQTEEEYNNALQETESYYNGLMSYRLSELDKTVVNSNLLYKEDWSNYEFYIGAKDQDNKTYSDNFTTLNHQMKVSQEDFFLTFGATTLGQITGYQSSQAALLAYSNSTAQVLPEIAGAFASTKDKINETLGLIGDGATLDNLAQKFTEFLGTSGDENSEGSGLLGEVSGAVDKINQDCEKMQTALTGVRDALEDWNKIDLKQFLETVAAGNKAFLDFQKAIAPEVKDPAKKQNKNNDNNSNNNKNNNNQSGTQNKSVSTQGDGKLQVGDKVKFESGVYTGDSYGEGGSGSYGLGKSVYITKIVKGNGRTRLYHISTGKKLGSGDLGWVSKDQLSGYDTGGYTGEWGPEGRLALLHQKEIVLNARDTENMLAMTQMVRDIAKQIDLTAVPTSQSLAPAAITDAYRDIQQNVTIHAEFPDATNAQEIEEAFRTLTLQASQYLNRK